MGLVLFTFLLEVSSAAATKLQLEFIGEGKPEKVTVRPDGTGDSLDVKKPWAYSLPEIPADQWQITLHVIISSDTTQSAANPMDLDIPLRFSRYHALQPVLRLPIYILTTIPTINDSFALSFESARPEENQIVRSLFNARYAYSRFVNPNGPFAWRILYDYLERAAGGSTSYSAKFSYVAITDDLIETVRQTLKDSEEAQTKFSSWTDPAKGIRNVSRLDQARFQAWDDLALATKASSGKPQLRDEKDRCVLTQYYLAQFDQHPEDQLTITNRLRFEDTDWERLRNLAASTTCKPNERASTP
jgi:hypothetical protein